MQTLRQLEFTLFTTTIHTKTPALNSRQIQQTLNDIRKQYAVVPAVTTTVSNITPSYFTERRLCSRLLLLQMGRSLASDAFDYVLKMKVFSILKRVKNSDRAILAVGGKDTALEAFVSFPRS